MNENELHKLFEKASQQAPLLDDNAIRSVLVSGKKFTKSSKKTSKIMTITIIASAVTLGLFYFNSDNIPEIVDNKTIQNIEVNSLEKEEINNKENVGVLDKKTRAISIENILKIEDKKAVFIQNTSKENFIPTEKVEETIPQIPILNVEEVKPQNTYSPLKKSSANAEIPEGFEKNTFIELDKNEMEKLGLYMKDGILMYEMETTSKGDMKAVFYPDGKVSLKNTRTDAQKNLPKNPLLNFITDQYGQGVISINPDFVKMPFEKLIKESKDLLPVWVQENDTSRVVIAWFENTPKILEILPEYYAETLKLNRHSFSHTVPEKIKLKEKTIFEKNTFIVLDKNEMEKLGLFIKDDIVMYEMKNTSKGEMKAYFMPDGGSNYSIKNIGILKLKKRNPLLCFITDQYGQNKNIINTDYSGKSQNELIEMSKKLIPVWIQENDTSRVVIAWFENIPKILEMLPEKYAKILKNDKYAFSHTLPKRVDAAKQIKSKISLSEIELADEKKIILDKKEMEKLGLFIKDDIVMYEMNNTCEGDVEAYINLYSERSGTKNTYNNSKEPKNPYLYFITDKYGQKIRYIDAGLIKSIEQMLVEKPKELIPVSVQENDTSRVVIAWFENIPKILEMLPEKYAKILKEDKYAFSHTLPKQIDKKEELTDNIISLNKIQLEKLGIFVKDDIFMLEMDSTKFGHFSTFITLGEGGSRSSYERRDTITDKDKLNGLICFLTDKKGKIIQVIDMDYEDYNDEYFIKISKDLLPILIQENDSSMPVIAWFEKTLKTISLLPEPYKSNLKRDINYYSKSLPNQVKSELVFPVYQKVKIDINPDQIVNLDAKSLKELGIVTQNPFYYYKKHKGTSMELKGFSSNINSSLFNIKENKLQNLFPDFITPYDSINLTHNDIQVFYKKHKNTNNRGERNYLTEFENDKFKMVAIKVEVSKGIYRLLWYKNTELILAAVNQEEREKTQKYLAEHKNLLNNITINSEKTQAQKFSAIVNNNEITDTKIKTITLSTETLAKLRITVKDKKISQSIVANLQSEQLKLDKSQKTLFTITYSKEGSISSFEITNENNTSKTIEPWLVTDDLGKSPRLVSSPSKDEDTFNRESFIPVLVISGEKYTTYDKLMNYARPDLIFWYPPTPEFLALLDEQSAKEIQSDLEALKCIRSKISFLNINETACDDDKEISCKYFEACENTINKSIQKYSVYPNPTNNNFNVKLELKQQANIKVTIVTINGVEIKEIDLGVFSEGINTKNLSTEGLPPGMYLLRITSDKGDVIVERLIVTD